MKVKSILLKEILINKVIFSKYQDDEYTENF